MIKLYVVFLRFSENKALAEQFMESHIDWIKEGIKNGFFLLSGSLLPNKGGVIFAKDLNIYDLSLMMEQDPFVKEKVVAYEVFEISPSLVQENLQKALSVNM